MAPHNRICVICQDSLADQRLCCHSHCGHVFHYECANQWFTRQPTNRAQCPICRSPTGQGSIQSIYFSEEPESGSSKYEDVTEYVAKLIDEHTTEISSLMQRLAHQSMEQIELERDLRRAIGTIARQKQQKDELKLSIHALRQELLFQKRGQISLQKELRSAKSTIARQNQVIGDQITENEFLAYELSLHKQKNDKLTKAIEKTTEELDSSFMLISKLNDEKEKLKNKVDLAQIFNRTSGQIFDEIVKFWDLFCSKYDGQSDFQFSIENNGRLNLNFEIGSNVLCNRNCYISLKPVNIGHIDTSKSCIYSEDNNTKLE